MHRALITIVAASISLPSASNAKAQWGSFPDRPLRLQDLVPPDGRRFVLESKFDYTDGKSRVWTAPTGLLYDGASIPKPFWSTIGGPFEGLYREAAVVHDAACCAQTADWRAAHHMFYEAMRCSGVGMLQAKTMFYAVWAGGPRWKKFNSTMPASCKRNLVVDPAVQRNIIDKLKTRPLTPLEAEAVARPFVTDRAMTSDDVSKFVADLKGRELTSDEQVAIAQSVVETVYFPPAQVRSVESWVKEKNPSLKEIEEKAEHARAAIDFQHFLTGSNQSFIKKDSGTGASSPVAEKKNTFFADVPDLSSQKLSTE